MKRWMCVGIILCCLVAACQKTGMVSPPDDSDTAAFDWQNLQVFDQNLLPEAVPVLDEMQTAPYYLLTISLDDELQSVKGTMQVRYTNTSPDTLPYLVFQLFPNVYGGETILGDVLVNQVSAAVDPVENEPVVHVQLNSPLQPGETVVVQLPFESTIPREMGGNYGLYGYFDDVLVLDGFYPLLAIYRDGTWHTNITSPNGDIKYEVMSLYQVWLTAPKKFKVISTGMIADHEEHKDTQTLHMVAGPVREFYLAASDQFITSERKVGGVTLLSTGLNGTEEAVEQALDIGEGAINTYGEHFGPYPYSELDVVSTPMQALGMEYPGVSTVTTSLYQAGGTTSGLPNRTLLESVVAHEIGHQWFFNLVGSDQIEEPWLDESMTQYIVSLFYVDYYNMQAALSYEASWDTRWSRVDHADTPIGLPSYDYDANEYSPIVYGRGPYFLLALEDAMGKDTFALALKNYFTAYEWKIATGADFKREMESTCACDLTPLFAEWVYP